jgi:hypothetical protein
VSNSRFVCARDGIPLTDCYYGFRHALGGKTGPMSKHRKHKPVPVLRTDYNRAFGIDTPLDEARALVAQFRDVDRRING